MFCLSKINLSKSEQRRNSRFHENVFVSPHLVLSMRDLGGLSGSSPGMKTFDLRLVEWALALSPQVSQTYICGEGRDASDRAYVRHVQRSRLCHVLVC